MRMTCRFLFSWTFVFLLLAATETLSSNRPAVLPGDLSLRAAAAPFEALALPDGSMVVGGRVRYANNVPVTGMVRILADGSVDSAFVPHFDSAVESFAVDATYLYVSGYFTQVDGAPVAGIARFRLDDRTLDSNFHPLPAGSLITAIAVRNGFLYELDAQTPPVVRKRSLADPAQVVWQTSIASNEFMDFLRLRPNGDVIVGPDYSAAPRLFKLSAATGTVDALWSPLVPADMAYGYDMEVSAAGDALLVGQGSDILGRFSGSGTGARVPGWTFATLPVGATVKSVAATADDGAIAVGSFISINGVPTPGGIARIAADGTVSSGWGGFDPAGKGLLVQLIDASRFILTTTARPGGDWVRAGFLATGQQDSAGFASVSVDEQGSARGVLADGANTLLFGRFDRAGVTPRAGLLRMDAALGIDTAYVPDTLGGIPEPDGIRGVALTSAGHYVLNAGFGAPLRVDYHRLLLPTTGVRQSLAMTLEPNNGSSAYTAPPLFDDATQMVYVSGRWRSGGVTYGARRFNVSTQTPDAAWIPNVGTQVLSSSAALTNDHYYIGGQFTLPVPSSALNLARMAKTGTGVVDLGWLPNPNGAVRVLLVDSANDRLYVGGGFSTIAGQARNGLARFILSTGALDADWQPLRTGAANDIQGLSFAPDGKLYVSGVINSASCSGSRISAVRVSPLGIIDQSWAVATDAYAMPVARELDSSRVFLAGAFTTVEGVARGATAVVATTATSDVIFVDDLGDPACIE